MPNRSKLASIATALSALLLMLLFASAAHSQSNAAAPIPAQITAAKKVFISNVGTDVNPFGPNSEYKGGSNRAYNEFYGAMKSWGRFELVASPSDADVVFEIRFTDPAGPPSVSSSKNTATYGAQQLRLVILDSKTHFTLWAITEFLPGAILQGNRDKNFEHAMESLLTDVKSLAP